MNPGQVPVLRRVVGRALPTVTGFATADPVVGLTFDDGPNPHCTPRLLDVLERHDALATFFVLGKAAAANAELMESIRRAGHAVGNHTWSHPSLPDLPRAERISEIRRCADIVGQQPVALFRPPYGHQTARTWRDARKLRHRVVAWSVAGLDWEDVTADFIAERLLAQTRPGSVVLLHDGLETEREGADTRERNAMLQAVDTVLGVLGQRYRFLTLPQLMAAYQPEERYWRSP